jgi:phage/plasmid primase-like uncharacterized protein
LPEAAICQRVESPKRCGESGWLHHLRSDGPTWSPRVRRIELSAARIGAGSNREKIDFGKLAADFRAAVRPEALARLAVSLGLSVESLRRLGVGWSGKHRAWSFAMTDAGGAVLGIRLRRPDGRKLAVRGGKEGLFVPEGFDVAGGRLLITEGPTDTAALLDLGFPAVGRPSCSSGTRLLVELVRKQNPREVVIVADADAPGQRGAERLAAVLVAYCAAVRVVAPPAGVKDARQWKQRGATAADVQAVIDAAPMRRLSMRIIQQQELARGKRK